MRTLRSVNGLTRLAYVSVPITSGELYYERIINNPFVEKDAVTKQVIPLNYEAGHSLVQDVVRRRGCPVVYPADLIPVHQQWEQADFQALWLSIIGEMVTEVHMSRGWACSNGCAEEFASVMQLRLGVPKHHDLIFFNTKGREEDERLRMRSIQVFDHRGKVITLEEGREAISKSVVWLEGHGIPYGRLLHCVTALDITKTMLRDGFYQ